METDLAAVRLVSSRYQELQGLQIVVIGASFALVFGAYLAVSPARDSMAIAIGVVISFAFIIPGQLLLDRYYRRRFGRVVSEPARSSTLWLSAGIAAAVTVTSRAFEVSPLAAGLPIVAARALWITIRDWPFRTHHLLGCAAAVAAVTVLFAAPTEGRASAEAIGFVLFGTAYVPVGILDHQLLVRTLRGPVASRLPSRQD